MADNNRIKVSGYAKRIFFNDNIEYRNFSPDLVGFQIASDGGTTLFTNGNFSISVNLDPKPDVLFTQGNRSKFFTLDDIVDSESQLQIQKNIKTNLNLDLTNPLSYVWYGSFKELLSSSLIELQNDFPAAIYVDNKVGSVTGNNITDYVYNIEDDESTFKVNSNFFVNPYNIKYTIDSKFVSDNSTDNPLRNLMLSYGSYVIEHNGIVKNIKGFSGSTQKTNSEITLVVEGNPFPELTGIFIPQFSFLSGLVDASIPYFIKPNDNEVESFFTGLNELQNNLLNREIYPEYRAEIIASKITDNGITLTSKKVLDFPILEDGYNLNFFDSFYIAYLDKLNELGENLDESKTDTIIRKYTTEAISSFDTIPRTDGDDLTLNGEKATKLLRIYGVEFDYVKKYINGIKFAHVVTYNKKNNIPDELIKDLSYMLGLEPIDFINDTSFSKLYLPSNGAGQFSGTSTNLTQDQIDIELYRRLILNIAWLWKSKGSRKAIEFLFRFIGAPESLVNFNEYVVLVDKPLDVEEIKKLLYIYTGEVDLTNIPYDKNGYPLPPINGNLVINDFINPETGEIVENGVTDMYFQKAGGWYKETYGDDSVTVLNGNNPHVGPYDGGSEYLQYFSRCYIPNFDNEPTVVITAQTLQQNYFINYNYGIFNGIPTGTTFYTTQLTYNENTGEYQPIDDCLEVNYSIIETPLQNDGKTTLQQAFASAESEYNEFLEKIKKDKYLVYSPEWQIIKNNYEVSLKNCLTEVATQDCDTNNTLEICLNDIEEESVLYSCDELTLNECLPFYYYTNEDGIKVSFDQFPECCSSNNAKYVTYINEYGRLTEYCSGKAPCLGKPVSVEPNGVVVFDMVNNTMPDNIYNINDICYQYIFTKEGDPTLLPESIFFNETGYSIVDYLELYLSGNLENTSNFDLYFEKVDCNSTTIISSPECCAWHGFNFTIVNDGENEYIACLKGNQLETPETPEFTLQDNLSVDTFTAPLINTTVNTSYYNLQNPIGGVYKYYSTEIFWDCFTESRIVKEVVNTTNNIVVQPNAILDDPSLMDPSNWVVFAIDEYGRVSFTPSIFDNNYILDWYSDEQVSDLYQTVAEFYGYTFGYFTIDTNSGLLIPFEGNNPYATNPNTVFSSAVDPERIKCADVDNVSVVFGSENWQGFKLPELEDCSCTIDFSFDYMLKYNANNLIECADNISCQPAIIYDNTINNLNCLNFVAFTNTEEESQILQNNFNDSENVGDEYIIWNNTNVLEPNTECCNAIGGNVVSVSQWATTNQIWVSQINETYNQLFTPTTELLTSLNFNTSEIISYIENYKTIKSEVETLISGCFNLTLLYPSCDIDYNSYINTQNICNLEMPLECGLWSKLLTDYKTLEESIKTIINQYSALGCDGSTIDDNTNIINEPKIANTQKINELGTQLEEELNKLKVGEEELKTIISEIEGVIQLKSSDNVVIEKAITNVENPLDCTVYENQLTELRNFNYNTYCNTIVYGNPNVNDGTRQSEYNSCVSSKTLENQNEEVLYSQLLEDCRSKNILEVQLKNAKFENDVQLITTLESQINEINVNINRLTTDYNNSISYDESKQNSTIQNNDIQNTINRTSELLKTTTESITDESGNLTLTDSQKITLNIEYVKNTSQINELNVQLQEQKALLSENLFKQSQSVTETKNEQNNLGSTLLSWGVGLLGLYSTLKGYIDPETTGTIMAAFATGGIKDGGGGGGGPVSGCIYEIGDEFIVFDTSSPTDYYKYIININDPNNPDTLCSSWYNSDWTLAGGGGTNIYEKGCCTATRVVHNPNTNSGSSQVDPDKDPVTTPSGGSSNNAPPLPEVDPEKDPVTTPSGGGSNNTTPICDFPNPSLFQQTTNGAIIYNGANIPEECCTQNVISIPGQYVFNSVTNECVLSDVVVDDGTVDPINCCDLVNVTELQNLLETLQSSIPTIEQKTIECYDVWYNGLYNNYVEFEEVNNTYYDSYLDDLKVNFKIFVNNTNEDTQTNIDTGLSYLPYTESVNPIWEWDPTSGYTGVILEGTEQEIATIEGGIFNHLSQLNISYNSEMFEPAWQTFNFTIPECVCDDLRRLYPNKEFFFSIELENIECQLCLLVDNIQVNVTDCQTQRFLSINDCMVPQLSCVIDNKKSWVYYDDGVITETIYPNGECNTGSTSNYDIVKLGKEQERLWLDLEYRYTDYNINHSDLILNVKNTSFSIDPAKAIECDVFNYWKNIDCDNCPTNCQTDNYIFESSEDYLFMGAEDFIFQDQSSLLQINFSGDVSYTSSTLDSYVLSLDGEPTTGLTFSCETYTDLLQTQVIELKNEYYTLTSDYNASLDANYYQLLEKGQTLSNFFIQKNNCGSDTLVINNNNSLNNLFGLIVEKSDGTIGFFESYLYTGTSVYSGGTLEEVISGVTAQTFNQTDSITSECCKSLNTLLNGEGVEGLGLGKNYQWDNDLEICHWRVIDDCANCKGDCEYCGSKKECVNGFETGDTYSVCVNPLDYLDIQPSEINIKAVFDQLVQTNLIDVKSRQTISDYPLLRLFYELYLNASNCGEDLSGKFTYNSMFEFMDKIGDYWLDLIEQVVPATTIWEGCDNSGKIYRNTIFDNNKFNYKKYSLNFISTEECSLSGQTDFSIGSENTYSVVEEKPIYPNNPQINDKKTEILNKEIEIALLNKNITKENSVLCSIKLQDLSTPNLQISIDKKENFISLLNTDLEVLSQELIELKNELENLEDEYIKQQKNYTMNFMSCSGITQNLIDAQNNLLSGFTQGTTAYETQRNFIAGLRDKYTKCVRKANTLVSDYNTIFITQIYDSNEYEGNVTINSGDPDWEVGGPFYNKELIHNCNE